MTNSNLTTTLLLKKFHSAILSHNVDFVCVCGLLYWISLYPNRPICNGMFNHPATAPAFSHTFNHIS